MDDNELQEYRKAEDEQKVQAVFFKCLLMQAGLIVPSFMLGSDCRAGELDWWPNLLWLFIMVIASASMLYTVISYFKAKSE